MSQLTIQLSDKADALIAQLQKEIFSRRRKKVSAAGVVETLVESGAKSQSDKRFATSWTNLLADIEKAAKLANAHGAKPANLTDEEWALVLTHRSRGEQATPRRSAARAGVKRKAKAAEAPSRPTRAPRAGAKAKESEAAAAPKAAASPRAASRSAAKAPKAAKPSAKAAPSTKVVGGAKASTGAKAPGSARSRTGTSTSIRAAAGSKPGTAAPRSRSSRSSAATRMAKAAGRLASGSPAPTATEAPPTLQPLTPSANGANPAESPTS